MILIESFSPNDSTDYLKAGVFETSETEGLIKIRLESESAMKDSMILDGSPKVAFMYGYLEDGIG
jgi:adenylate kinase family enzyme